MESPKVQKVSHGLSKVVIFETENLRFAGFVELSSSTHESAGWVFFFDTLLQSAFMFLLYLYLLLLNPKW